MTQAATATIKVAVAIPARLKWVGAGPPSAHDPVCAIHYLPMGAGGQSPILPVKLPLPTEQAQSVKSKCRSPGLLFNCVQ